MKFSFLTIIVVLFASYAKLVTAQSADEVYRQDLKKVLNEIERKYQVKLLYEEKNIKGKMVDYADWRYRKDISSTLDNVLLPLDMVWKAKGNGAYEIGKYEYFRKEFEEGKANLDKLLSFYPDQNSWEKRKSEIKDSILKVLGINPNASRKDLKVITTSRRIKDGYSVENVAIESFPGYYITGSLYKPLKKGQYPAILNPHGHFYNKIDPSIPDERGRYRPDMQYRCAALAKMGAVVFNYDMYSYGESVLQSGNKSYHKTGFALAIQTWNSIRVVDFLTSLQSVDKSRIGITGASGGGTQTFIATALDDRITASCPVVMVSSSFYGGCNCESGLPIHTSCGTNNAEITAMAAPRPQMVISDGNDWTKTVPTIEYPYLKKIYAFYSKDKLVQNVHLPEDNHDYGFSKRVPMYQFFANQFNLDLNAISDKNGNIDESGINIEKSDQQLVFANPSDIPVNMLRKHDDIVKSFQKYHNRKP